MMKVSPNLRLQFSNQEALNQLLKEKVDDLVCGAKPAHWHYESRLKALESYALKLESGRVDDPGRVEDFFGCTLVVRNAAEIPAAEALVSAHFEVLYQRPKDRSKTHKPPESFPFDDLRLYAQLKRPQSLPRIDVEQIVFEVQIKTFLQHAWGIATHDLVYKNREVKWSKARIAYQIKAMLEHAELAIEEAGKLSEAPLVDRTTRDIDEVTQILEILSERWPPERLPEDRKRLAENIRKVIRTIRVSAMRLAEIVDVETDNGRGARLIDASPYTAIIQAIINHERRALEKFLARPGREKIAVPSGLEIDSQMPWPPTAGVVLL